MTDYYAVLELDQSAAPEDIRQQYRLLIHAWHPDKFPGSSLKIKAEAKTMLINEAYETLANPTLRSIYDRKYGEYQDSLRGTRKQPPPATSNATSAPKTSKGATHTESRKLRTCPHCYKLQVAVNINCNRCGLRMDEDGLKAGPISDKTADFKTCPNCFQLLRSTEMVCRRCHARVV